MTSALILAAGASTRLGSPKQLVLLNGETLLDRTVRIAREAGCHPILVVLGSSAEQIQQHCTLRDAHVLINQSWREGMASTIRLGIEGLSLCHADGVIILSCDMPTVTPCHLRALQATGTITGSRYSERNGIPAFFPQRRFSDLLTLTGDTGARNLLCAVPSLRLENGELDIDTQEDVTQMNLTEHSM